MILAATGHRPEKLGGYTADVDSRLCALALKHVKLMHPTEVISGMALGWDMAIARAALVANVPFVAAVPFHGQELRWPVASQIMYRQLLDAASLIEFVSPGSYEPWKMAARNRWMVNRADHVLALWDRGEDGGTAHCVAYANKKKLPVTNVWEEWSVK